MDLIVKNLRKERFEREICEERQEYLVEEWIEEMRISNHRMLVRDPSRLHLHWACEMPEEDDEGKVPVHLTRRVKEGPDLSSSSRLDPLLIWKMAQIQSWNAVCWYGGTSQIGIKKTGKKKRYVDESKQS